MSDCDDCEGWRAAAEQLRAALTEAEAHIRDYRLSLLRASRLNGELLALQNKASPPARRGALLIWERAASPLRAPVWGVVDLMLRYGADVSPVARRRIEEASLDTVPALGLIPAGDAPALWNPARAREVAWDIAMTLGERYRIAVLCSGEVARAFGLPYYSGLAVMRVRIGLPGEEPLLQDPTGPLLVLVMPEPHENSLWWQDPANQAAAAAYGKLVALASERS